VQISFSQVSLGRSWRNWACDTQKRPKKLTCKQSCRRRLHALINKPSSHFSISVYGQLHLLLLHHHDQFVSLITTNKEQICKNDKMRFSANRYTVICVKEIYTIFLDSNCWWFSWSRNLCLKSKRCKLCWVSPLRTVGLYRRDENAYTDCELDTLHNIYSDCFVTAKGLLSTEVLINRTIFTAQGDWCRGAQQAKRNRTFVRIAELPSSLRGVALFWKNKKFNWTLMLRPQQMITFSIVLYTTNRLLSVCLDSPVSCICADKSLPLNRHTKINAAVRTQIRRQMRCFGLIKTCKA